MMPVSLLRSRNLRTAWQFGQVAIFTYLAVVILVAPVAAAEISTLNYARFYGSQDPRQITACAQIDGTACAGSALVPGTDWLVSYSSQSLGTFGNLHAVATVELLSIDSADIFESFLSVGARASFRDTMIILGGTGTGVASFGFTVSGFSIQSPGTSARPQFQYVPTSNGELLRGQETNYLVDAQGNATILVPFTFGMPTDFQIDFYALAQIFVWQAGAAARADYFNTATLSSIVVRDSSGAIVSDFNIVAESGTTYGARGVAVPEPASMLLLGTALVGVGVRRWRQSRS